MKITYVSALGEGDGECVSLANRFDCYVIAQDSDYFCYYLVRGYIPFNSMDMDQILRGVGSLTVQLYHMDSLLRQFAGLQPSTLALACCICGNDHVNRDLTQSILNHLVRRVYISEKFERSDSIQIKYLYASMQWMRQFDCFDSALQQSCQLINSRSEQVYLQNKLRATVQSYLRPPDILINQFSSSNNSNLPTDSYFVRRAQIYSQARNMGDSQNIAQIDGNLLSIISKGAHQIPRFLCDALCNLRLSSSFIDILIHRRFICKAHIETENKPSIYECAIPLLLPCFAILLRWDNEYIDPVIYIHHRVRNQLERCHYPLRRYLNNVPGLDEIQSMSRDNRRNFVRTYLESPNKPYGQWNQIDSDYHFWLMIIRYWYIKRGRQPVFLYAVIVCLIKTVFLRTDYESKLVEEQIRSISLAFGDNGNRLRNFPDVLQQLNAMDNEVVNNNVFDNSIVYELNCLQTIY
ncbi:unnamed protein product, partial [Adineta steineri]